MIFERRAYTLRPGNMAAFWDLQRTYCVTPAYGELVKQNLAYFATLAGRTEEVVHVYRFDSMAHWQATYDALYAGHNPEYFKRVRPLMLKQENGYFAPAPIGELSGLWTGATPMLPASLKASLAGSPENVRVVERVLDFFPGGLPVFWDAYRELLAADADLAQRNLMAVLVSVGGRLHRVLHYRGYASTAAAEADEAARAANPHWRKFVGSIQGLVAESYTTVLQPSPLPIQRSLFERDARSSWLRQGHCRPGR